MFNVLGDHLRGRRTYVQKGGLDRLGEPAQPAAVDDRHVSGAAIGPRRTRRPKCTPRRFAADFGADLG